jgi:hypothetical protein
MMMIIIIIKIMMTIKKGEYVYVRFKLEKITIIL